MIQNAFRIKKFFHYLTQVLKNALFLTLISVIETLLIIFVLPFYYNQGGVIGLAALNILFWSTLFWTLASIYFFPIRTQLNKGSVKIFKKCFIFTLDNTLYTLYVGIATLLLVYYQSCLLPFYRV
jgi:hypothetical protein